MADEGDDGGGDGGGGGGDGGSALKKYGPLALIVLLAQVVLAWVVIEFALKDNVPEEGQEDLIPEQTVELLSGGQQEEKSRLPFYYTSEGLSAITANPAATNSERFVVLTVQLGLEAYNRDESPPDDDITGDLKDNTEVLDKIKLYDQRIVSVISKTARRKTVDELDGEFLHEIEDEIRKRLNKEIFERLFRVDEDHTTEVIVTEVDISNMIIQ
ncbi:MAG: flagellar basal body-associated FliL family protein [Candidatus Latescibacterota bacterium]